MIYTADKVILYTMKGKYIVLLILIIQLYNIYSGSPAVLLGSRDFLNCITLK